MRKIAELLAPAGDMDCLKAALAAGADAVYLGGRLYGARSYAGNFGDEELLDAIRLAHFFEKKVYLTVNTLIKESELDGLIEWMRPFYAAGLDGVIIQDLGVLERCREAFPGLALHISTQATVTEASSALFLKSLGACRVVPARELGLTELSRLKRESGMELEVFVHGAMCYSYSGQCLFSSLLGGRSGNRGKCAQPCRLPYRICREKENAEPGRTKGALDGVEEQYPLSLKDLCALSLLPRLLEAGVDSLKIEGRMKSPVYVAGVTAIYRKYLDLYASDPKTWRVEQADLDRLSGLYVRSGLQTGYFERWNGKNMVTEKNPGYLGTDPGLFEEIRKEYLDPELARPADLFVSVFVGQPISLTVFCGGHQVFCEGMTVLKAQNKPLRREDVEKQFARAGGSHFGIRQLEIEMGEDCFLPLSAMNDLRRRTFQALFEEMTAPEEGRAGQDQTLLPAAEGCRRDRIEPEREKTTGRQAIALHMAALTAEQAMEGVRSPRVKRVYLTADAIFSKKADEPLWRMIRERKAKDPSFSFFLTLPVILRFGSVPYLDRLARWLTDTKEGALVDGFLASSLSGLLWAGGQDRAVALNHTIPVFNRKTLETLMKGARFVSYAGSFELNRRELDSLPLFCQERMVYGRIPMMISANCVRKTAGECRRERAREDKEIREEPKSMEVFLKDRLGVSFPVLTDCTHCMNTVYNSVPLSLHQYLPQLESGGVCALRLDFTDEDADCTARILQLFSQEGGTAFYRYTTGHYKKGVS